MQDIGSWTEACRAADEKFAEGHPLGFLLYSVKHGPLIPVDMSVGETLNRVLLPDSGPIAAVTPATMFKVFPLGPKEIVKLGSNDACDVTVNDESISSDHARIFLKDGVVYIADLGSTLGTQVDKATLSEGEARELPSGASLTLGSIEFRYLSAEKFAVFVTGLLGD